MTKNLSKRDLIKVILEDIDDSEMIEEDIIHMIINEKVAKDVSKEHERHLIHIHLFCLILFYHALLQFKLQLL